MAHHAKCNKGNASGGRMMLDHDKRQKDDNRERSNPNIDVEKTHLNRDYGPGSFDGLNPWDWACRYAQEHSSKAMRSNAIIMSMDVVHLPKNWEEVYPGVPASEFFEKIAIPFERERYGFNGNENEISAVVHYDETKIDGHEGRPHLHYKYVPITKDGKCSHKVVNCRLDLQTYHSDLVRFAREAGYPGLDLYNEEAARAREYALTMPEYKRAMEIVADAKKAAELSTDRLEYLQQSRSEVEGRIEALEATINAQKAESNREPSKEELREVPKDSELREREQAARGNRVQLEERISGIKGQLEQARSRFEDIKANVLAVIESVFAALDKPQFKGISKLCVNMIAKHHPAAEWCIQSTRNTIKEDRLGGLSFKQTLRNAERSAAARNAAIGSRSRGRTSGRER